MAADRVDLGDSAARDRSVQGGAGRVGQQRLLLGLKLPVRAQDGIRYVHAEGLLAPQVA
jgi:hypothetical protein